VSEKQHQQQDGTTGSTAQQELKQLALRGVKSGFDAVFAQYGDEAFRFGCALVGSKRGKELIQRVARRASTGLESREVPANALKWLLQETHSEAAESVPELAAPPPGDGAPVQEQQQAVAAAAAAPFAARFEALAAPQRGGLVLRELGKLGYPAIADILKIDPATVRESVRGARLALQPDVPRVEPLCDVTRGLMADDQRAPSAAAAVTEHLGACPECPKVQRAMDDLPGALDRAIPRIAPSELLRVIKDARRHAPGARRGKRAGRTRRRRALVLAALALVLASAATAGLATNALDAPEVREAFLSRTALGPASGIGGVTARGREATCPRGTRRVRDHCEPICPEGSRFVEGECVVDPPVVACEPPAHLVDGRCLRPTDPVDPPLCRVGVLRNGRCVVPEVCGNGAVIRRGRCERPGVCPRGTRRVRNGDCLLPVRPRVICPPGTTRAGRVCRAPVRCAKGSRPVGRRCVLPAVCPRGTIKVNGACELPPVCPAGTTPSPQGCVGDVVCPPGTAPQGIRCVRPCPRVLWKVSHPCLDPRDPYTPDPPAQPDPPRQPDPDPGYPDDDDHGYPDRHGDRHGHGHRPGRGRGHDPDHNSRPGNEGEWGAAPAPSPPPADAQATEDTTPAEPPAPALDPPPADPAPPADPQPPATDPSPPAAVPDEDGDDPREPIIPPVAMLGVAGLSLYRRRSGRR
jgi:DNA-directed RNA polymerase specialized sigma24 family protein